MDPLSIASAASGLVAICTKCSVLLYKYIDDMKSVDSTVGLFCSEIDSLAQVLDAISTSFDHPPTAAAIAASQSYHGGALWINVTKLLEKCGIAMSRLKKILQRLENTRGGILRRPIKQIKFSIKSADIVILRQQVQSHNIMMQIALQSISVCVQLHGNSTSEDTATLINSKLDKIRDEIYLLQKQNGDHTNKNKTVPIDNEESSHSIAELENPPCLHNPGLAAQDLYAAGNEYVENLEDCLQPNKLSVSNARTVAEPRASIAGSIEDVPLDLEFGGSLTPDNEESSHPIAEPEDLALLNDSDLPVQDLRAASNEYVNNLKDCLQSANVFVSNARTVTESRTSIVGSDRDVPSGLEFGGSLTTERRVGIEEWILQPASNETIMTGDRSPKIKSFPLSSAEKHFLNVCSQVELLGFSGNSEEAVRVGMDCLAGLWDALSGRLQPYTKPHRKRGVSMKDSPHFQMLQQGLLLSDGRGFFAPKYIPHETYTVAHFLAHLGATPELGILYNRGDLDPNVKDHVGKTPLIRAARMGHQETVAFLLEQPGVDANAMDSKGCTSLDYAFKWEHRSIIEMLLFRWED